MTLRRSQRRSSLGPRLVEATVTGLDIRQTGHNPGMDLAALQGLMTALAVIAGVSGVLTLLAFMEPQQVGEPSPTTAEHSPDKAATL